MHRLVSILLLILLNLNASNSYADSSNRILVLYPQMSATYNQIFSKIVAGIDSYPETEISTLTLSKTSKKEAIEKLIRTENIDAIIALGQSSYNIAHEMKKLVPVIHGGLLIKPNGHSGISLVGDPSEFFSHLRALAPSVKRVFTVYNEKNSSWLIHLANIEAKKYNIELTAVAANDMRDAVHKFRKILDTPMGSHDAIWLLLDKVLPDKTVLPLALEASWKRNIILFSNNPSHTKRGALFSLFPDHSRMGYSLAKLANKQVGENNGPLVLPLVGLKISFNERTASHLGLRYSKAQLDNFDIIYPQR